MQPQEYPKIKIDPTRLSHPQKLNKLTITGFVLSLILPPVGLVVSIIALRRAKKSTRFISDQKFAKAGIILSLICSILFSVIFYVICLKLPEIERGQRNNARRDRVAKTVDAVKEYKANHDNKLPQKTEDLSLGNIQDSKSYIFVLDVNILTEVSKQNITLPYDEVLVLVGAKCGPDDDVTKYEVADAESASVFTQLEDKAYYCQDV